MLQSASRGGCLVWRGAWSGGVSGPGGVWSRGLLVWGVCLVWGVSGGVVPGLGGGAWSGGPPPGGANGPGGVCVWSGGRGIPACTEADTPPPPPPVDRHTLVKTLPWPNFVAAGKKLDVYKIT